MKCKNCGGTLNLEDEVCVHCGAKNEHAVKHIENMKKYSKDYEETKNEVYSVTKKNTSITVKSVIIALLVVGIVACLALFALLINNGLGNSYKEEMENVIALEEQLIQEKKFFLLGKLAYGLHYSDVENYYIYIDYSDIYEDIMEMQEKDAYATMDKEEKIIFLVEKINKFYKYIDEESSEPYYNVKKEDLTNVEEQLKAMLVAYCGLTKEEASNFQNMSTGEKILLLEERINHE